MSGTRRSCWVWPAAPGPLGPCSSHRECFPTSPLTHVHPSRPGTAVLGGEQPSCPLPAWRSRLALSQRRTRPQGSLRVATAAGHSLAPLALDLSWRLCRAVGSASGEAGCSDSSAELPSTWSGAAACPTPSGCPPSLLPSRGTAPLLLCVSNPPSTPLRQPQWGSLRSASQALRSRRRRTPRP